MMRGALPICHMVYSPCLAFPTRCWQRQAITTHLSETSGSGPLLLQTLTTMTCLRRRLSHLWANKRETIGTVLDVTVRGLEVSKDAITAAAPVPGLGPALDVTIALLRKVQVCTSRNHYMLSGGTSTDLSPRIQGRIVKL